MTIGKNTLTALKAYYRKPFEPIDTKAVFDDLEKESDRAAVIIMGSILEDSLALSLMTSLKMRKCKDRKELEQLHERVFGFNGPIGSFSEKIITAFAFEAIERETYDQLTIIRELRNACAHSQEPLNFQMPVLSNYCANLFAADNDPFTEYNGDPKTMRVAFMSEAMFLSMTLTQGSRSQARNVLNEHFAAVSSARKRD